MCGNGAMNEVRWNYRVVQLKGEGNVWKASCRRWTAGVNPFKRGALKKGKYTLLLQSLQDSGTVIRGDAGDIGRANPVKTFGLHLENSRESRKDFKADFCISLLPDCKFHEACSSIFLNSSHCFPYD